MRWARHRGSGKRFGRQSGKCARGRGRCVCRLCEASLGKLRRNDTFKDRVQVPADHVFVGFDAYKKVIDCGVDVIILATPPHFRPQHLAYAVEKGKHAFVEKPVAVDAPGVRSIIETCKKAKEKNLAVVSGLCWRYHPAVRETVRRIVEDKAIGDIVAIQSTYNGGTLWHRGDDPKWSRMEYQVRNWLYFHWLSGDHICEQAVHSLDKTAWLQGDIHPTQAFGMGGRQQRVEPEFGDMYDHHTVFYEYPTGVRVYFTCRQQNNVSESGRRSRARHERPCARCSQFKIEGEKPWHEGKDPKIATMYVIEHVASVQQHSRRQADQQRPLHGQQHDARDHGADVHLHRAALTWDKCFHSQERLGPTEYAWNDNVPTVEVAIPGKTKFA